MLADASYHCVKQYHRAIFNLTGLVVTFVLYRRRERPVPTTSMRIGSGAGALLSQYTLNGVGIRQRRATNPKAAHRSRKLAGVMMGMPRKGWSTSRSSSPLMIRSALPLTASSRNLSSFGSRQARTT